MKSTIWPFVALLLFSCGDDAPDEPTIEGVWYLESDSKECGLGLLLDAGDYELATVCELTSGELVAEVQAGTFSADGQRITFQPVRSSCADDRAYPETLQCSLSDGLLQLSGSQGELVFERLEAERSNGRLTYGCFDEAGIFTPMPIEIIGR